MLEEMESRYFPKDSSAGFFSHQFGASTSFRSSPKKKDKNGRRIRFGHYSRPTGRPLSYAAGPQALNSGGLLQTSSGV